MKSLFALFAMVLMAVTPEVLANLKDDMTIAGVDLGMSREDFAKLARSRNRKLVGPSKGVLDSKSRAQAQEYSIDRNQNLGSWSGLQRQSIMLLNNKVVAVELNYSSKSSFDAFVRDLEKLGFEKGATDASGTLYSGKMLKGDYAGRSVDVRVNSFRSGGRRGGMVYTVMVRCLEVLGEGVTLEKIETAQQGGPQGQQGAPKKGLGDLL